MFQTLQICYIYIYITIARNNYFKLDKVTLTKWVDKALLQSLKKKTIKLRFRICRIWSLNLVAMVGKFRFNEVFTAIENAY
jgi:hypothetical protein